MTTSNAKTTLTFILTALLVFPAIVQAGIGRDNDSRQEHRTDDRRDDRQDNRVDGRSDDRQDDRVDDRRDHRQDARVDSRRDNNHLRVTAPRHRTFNKVVIVRNYGHSYLGYGHHMDDNDALKWLAFTAITLKILDNIDEQAQREHEAAQIKASTASVGEKIHWKSDSTTGYVVTTKEGRSDTGLTCREFQQNITVGGQTENAYGTACLQADGAWKVIS